MFSHLSASLQGLHTIRAMHMEQKLSTEFNAHQDLHTEAWFLFLSTSRWLGIRMDILSVVFIACVVYLSVLTSDCKYISLSAALKSRLPNDRSRPRSVFASLKDCRIDSRFCSLFPNLHPFSLDAIFN